jgi:hypothetical protein
MVYGSAMDAAGQIRSNEKVMQEASIWVKSGCGMNQVINM